MQKQVVVLASGAGSLFETLVNYSNSNQTNFKVTTLVTDQEQAPVIKKAEGLSIDVKVILPSDYSSMQDWSRALLAILKSLNPDYIFLLGFMKILNPEIVNEFKNKILNSHPSLLPKYPGAHAVKDALSAGENVTGFTIHFVDEGLDSGPIILQQEIQVLPGDSVERLHERIKATEREVICDVMDRLAANGFNLIDGKVVLS